VLLASRAAASGMSDVDNELLIYNTAVVQCNCSNAIEFWIGNTAALPTLAAKVGSAAVLQKSEQSRLPEDKL